MFTLNDILESNADQIQIQSGTTPNPALVNHHDIDRISTTAMTVQIESGIGNVRLLDRPSVDQAQCLHLAVYRSLLLPPLLAHHAFPHIAPRPTPVHPLLTLHHLPTPSFLLKRRNRPIQDYQSLV